MRTQDFDDAETHGENTKPTATTTTTTTAAPAAAAGNGGSALAAMPTQPPVQQTIDPFALYLKSEDGGAAFFEGDYVFFNGQTGVWSRGSEKELIGATMPFLFLMHEIWIGWIKLADGKIVGREGGRIVDGYQRLSREALDDFEERRWPFNRRGEREDPWKKVTYLPMRCMEDGKPVVYGPFSDSARGAIKNFVAVYRRSDRAGKLPVGLLKNRSFQNQSGGVTFVPVFEIAGWEYLDGQPTPEPQPVAVPIAPPVAVPIAAPAKAGEAKAIVASKPKRGELGDMGDEIPF
jgi:hypothetical protein